MPLFLDRNWLKTRERFSRRFTQINWKTQIYTDKDKEKRILYRRFEQINADKTKKEKEKKKIFSQRCRVRRVKKKVKTCEDARVPNVPMFTEPSRKQDAFGTLYPKLPASGKKPQQSKMLRLQ